MSEMVDRVAQALELGVCKYCRRSCVGGHTPTDCERKDCTWERPTNAEQARAAIEAMREPTEAMRETCWSHHYEANEYSEGVMPEQAAHNWELMVDEALK